MSPETWPARLATVADASEVARLLHDFNTEFDTPSPGPAVLEARLRNLLAGDAVFAILAGDPSVGVALITLRPNVWYAGSVALLDELYVEPWLRGRGIGSGMFDLLMTTVRERGVDLVEILVGEGDVDAQRFYVSLGFASTEPDSTDRGLYFFQELTT